MMSKWFKPVFFFVLVALFLAYEMGIQVSPGVMANELMKDLNLNAYGLGLIASFYYYSYTIMQIPAGLLYDRFPVRIVIVIPLIVCSVGALLFSTSGTLMEASLARLLMGAGSAFAFIAVLVVAGDMFPERRFALMAGLTQMLAAFGAMGGELPMHYLVASVGWRASLWILGAIGLVLAGLIWFVVRYTQPPRLTAGQSNSISGSLLAVVSNSQTWIIAFYACLMWAPMATFASLWGVPYLTLALQTSKGNAANLVGLMWLGIAVGSPLLGWWSNKIGLRRLPLLLAAALGLLMYGSLMFMLPQSALVVAILIFMTGASCAGQALSFAVIREINQPANHAAAIGFNNMAVVIAGAIFLPLVGRLMQYRTGGGNQLTGTWHYLASDYHFGLLAIVLTYVLALLVAMFIKETRCAA